MPKKNRTPICPDPPVSKPQTPTAQKQTDQEPLSEPLTHPPPSAGMDGWEKAKEEGNCHFSKKNYELASRSYTLAIAFLEKTIDANNNEIPQEYKGTLAKLYGNRAAAHFQVALAHEKKSEAFERLLQLCVDNCEVAIGYDLKYEKAHFRCALALHKLGSHPEKTVKHLDKVLALYKSNGKDYSTDQAMIKLLHDSNYFSIKKISSVNWDKVKFKENCKVLDPYGAGDFTTITPAIFANGKKVSLLVRPGRYKVTDSIEIIRNYELDIVGDINEKDDEITFLCTGGNIYFKPSESTAASIALIICLCAGLLLSAFGGFFCKSISLILFSFAFYAIADQTGLLCLASLYITASLIRSFGSLCGVAPAVVSAVLLRRVTNSYCGAGLYLCLSLLASPLHGMLGVIVLTVLLTLATLASGRMFERADCNIFTVTEGTLSMRHVHLRQASDHPERHAIFAINKAEIELNDCKCYSKCSGCIALVGNSKLTMSGCAFERACGGVIVVTGSQANISGCSFDHLARIGVEVRDEAFATVTDSQFSHCGRQAITCHAGGSGFIAEDCMFYGNMTQHGDQQTGLSVAAGNGFINNCQLINNKGGGVMVQEGGKATIKGCHISGGRIGVGFSVLGEGTVQDCKLINVKMGFAIIMNQGGCVSLKNNTVEANEREVVLGPGDLAPNMTGTQHTLFSKADGKGLKKEDVRRMQRLLKGDKLHPEAQFADPRKFSGMNERRCIPCGFTQRALGSQFQQCSSCKTAWYCSKKCQKKDWPLHKDVCKTVQKTLNQTSAQE